MPTPTGTTKPKVIQAAKQTMPVMRENGLAGMGSPGGLLTAIWLASILVTQGGDGEPSY